MTTRRDATDGSLEVAPASLLDALLVYAEPLASGAYAVVVGNAESSVAEQLLESGARSVHVFDPDPLRAASVSRTAPRGVTVHALAAELDVRDGAFDLAVVPDLSLLDDPGRTLGRLRRAVAARGAVVAMARVSASDAPANDDAPKPFASDIGDGALEYGELYELFANEFEDVLLAGVVPFRGVVFAQLGTDDEAPAVSVDTRLASGESPDIFVVVARNANDDEQTALDPYAIVQLPELLEVVSEQAAEEGSEELRGFEAAAVAAAQLRVGVLTAQLDEARENISALDARTVEMLARLERAAAERDAALTRAMELETILSAAQHTMATLERRLLEAEQGMLDRDDQLATLNAELDARQSLEASGQSEAERVQAVRAESAEAALALHVADLAQVVEAHTVETAGYEEQLRERARVIAGLERELGRREILVKELVASLEESRESAGGDVVFESAAPLAAVPPRRDPALEEEVVRLRAKLDELAAEVARREGELTARAWRITELENERGRRFMLSDAEMTRDDPDLRADLERELARAQSELDALRQALAQEHAARVAAESDDTELTRVRTNP